VPSAHYGEWMTWRSVRLVNSLAEALLWFSHAIFGRIFGLQRVLKILFDVQRQRPPWCHCKATVLMRTGRLSLRADSFGRHRVVHAACVRKPDNHIMFRYNGTLRILSSLFVDNPEPYCRGSRSPEACEHCDGGNGKVKSMFQQSTMPNVAGFTDIPATSGHIRHSG